jgi:hypothetical protein
MQNTELKRRSWSDRAAPEPAGTHIRPACAWMIALTDSGNKIQAYAEYLHVVSPAKCPVTNEVPNS